MPDFLTVETVNSPSYSDCFPPTFTHSPGRRSLNWNEVLFVEPGKEARPEILQGKIPVSAENMGIAGVVPALLLHEILFSDQVRALRGKAQ
jgi:hypothetical protein